MAIVKQYHKDTKTTYVYESESYWDPEKKQSRSKRRLIGKLDPVTGEMIPTGKRGRKPNKPAVQTETRHHVTDAEYERTQWRLASQANTIQAQAQRIRELEQKILLMQSAMQKAAVTLERAHNMLTEMASK